ncbi:MAG: efflux transporter outer membrane subunit [Gemmatimonadota bacterium]|nr:efflux transporter outer membrane subunit [Gemmatimonadota bacterium]
MSPTLRPAPRRAPAASVLFVVGPASAVLLGACSFAPAPSVPEPVAELPDAFAEPAAAGSPEALEWWRGFEDPALNAVVDSVLASNFDLAEAVARVQQARAQAGIARAGLFPVVQGTATATDQDTPANAGFGQQFRELTGTEEGDAIGGFQFPERLGVTTWSLGAEFAYELDFWGRARNDARAAGLSYLASESDYDAARIGVLAETITTYFEIADLRTRIALTSETADVLLEREELADTRYESGLITSQELYQVRQELLNTQAVLPQLESQLVNAEGRLAVLMGGFRDKLDRVLPGSLAPVPSADPVAAGVPADLLLQRPDVRASALRLEAARHSIGVRKAELLPSLSLSGTIGVQAAEADGLFNVDQWFRNLLGNLTAPIFQGGRLRNNVAAAEAAFQQAAAAYGRTVVTAVHEVEAALAALQNEGRRYDYLTSQLEEANASVALQLERYSSGVAGYTDYLDALRSRLNVESTLAGSRRDLALARLAVHRALGGDWTAPPEVLEAMRMVPANNGNPENGRNR